MSRNNKKKIPKNLDYSKFSSVDNKDYKDTITTTPNDINQIPEMQLEDNHEARLKTAESRIKNLQRNYVTRTKMNNVLDNLKEEISAAEERLTNDALEQQNVTDVRLDNGESEIQRMKRTILTLMIVEGASIIAIAALTIALFFH